MMIRTLILAGWLLLTAGFFSNAQAQSTNPAKAGQRYNRTLVTVNLPDVILFNQEGDQARLLDLMKSDRPVMVDFIYATCTTICPVLSAGFSNLQRKLGPDREKVVMISFSIDPEHDTPEIMKEYLETYGAESGWHFYTGSRDGMDRLMKAFGVFVTNKMNHLPVTFLRKPGETQWVKIYGLISTADLMSEYHKLLTPGGAR